MVCERKKFKEEWSMRRYGQSYISLCSDKKRIVDQMYLLKKMEEKEKSKGCK